MPFGPPPERDPTTPRRLELLRAALRALPPGAKVLDAGCGGGLFLSGMLDWGYEVTGTDLSSKALELAAEIGETVSRGPDEACFLVRRRFVWMGRWLRHGRCFPDWQQRLVRRGRARYEDRSVNERLVVDGKIGKLKGCLIHEDRKGLSAWLEKHNRYSTMEALESLREGRDGQVGPRLFTRDPIARKRFIQRRVWPWVPFKPTAFFLYQYILRLGFLDGAAGYRYARLKSQYIYWTELKKRELLRTDGARPRGDRV